MATKAMTTERPPTPADELTALEAQLSAAEAEGERLRTEERRLQQLVPVGAGAQRADVSAVDVIRAKQALPGVRLALENNLLAVDDLRTRVLAARALAHAEIRQTFLPRQHAAAARVVDAMTRLEEAFTELVAVEDAQAAALGRPRPLGHGTSLALAGWVVDELGQESRRAYWTRTARREGWLPS